MSSVLEIIVMGEDRASGVLGRVGGALGNLGQSATRLGMDLLPLSAGAAVVAGGALKMAADYERSMDVLQASTGASAAEMQALGKLAVDLGADMTLPATSAEDAADAMLELSKAGLSVKDTMAAARGVLQLSAAAQISNSEAALITANALNMFKLSGDKATAVADLLAAGANKSSANIQQMADALQMAGNVAANAGLTIGDTTTAIALMANEGIRGSDAGTSLKQMLLSLQAPTGKAADLMKALGINIYDANGTMLPMPQLIANFGGALSGLTQQQRNAALATIFGSDAVRAANVLLLGGTQAWNDMSAAVGAGGAAAKMAAAQNKGLSGALDGLKSVIETTLLTAAGPLLDTLAGIVRWVGELVGRVAEANPQLLTAGIAFAGVLAVAAPLALGIGLISTALGALLAPVGLAVLAVAGLAAAWTTDFGGVRTLVESTVSSLVEKFGWVRDAVVDAGWQSSEAWEAMSTIIGERGATIAQGVMRSWESIRAVITQVVNAVLEVVSAIFGQVEIFMASHGEQIKTFIVTAWEAISGIIDTTLAIIQATIVPALQAITDFIRTHGTEIQAVFSAIWAAISGIIDVALTAIQGILKAILQAINGDWKGAWETLKATGANIWETIKATISTIAAALGPILAAIWEGIKAAAAAAWEAMKAKAAEVWTNIQAQAAQLWANVVDAIKGKIEDALRAVVSWLDDTLVKIESFDLRAAARQFFGTILPGILAAAAEALEKVAAWLKDVWNKISKHDLKDATKTSFATVVSGIAAKVPDILKSVGSFLTDAAAKIKNHTFKSQTMTAIQTVVVGILDKLGDVLTAVGTLLTEIRNKVSGFSLRDVGAALIQGMIEGVKSKAGEIAQAARAVVEGAIAAAKAALKMKSPSQVFAEIGRNTIEGLIVGFDEKKVEAAKKIAEGVASIVAAAVDAADALRRFKPVDGLGVITAQIMEFLLGVEKQFTALVRQVDEKLAVKAKEFAEAAGPVVALIGSGVEAIASLRSSATRLTGRQVEGVLDQVSWILLVMADRVAKWSRTVATDVLEAAKSFAENAGPVVDLIGGALEVIGALRSSATNLSGSQVEGVLDQVSWILLVMADRVAKWARTVATDVLEAAKSFAENAGPVVDLIGSGLEVIAALQSSATNLSGSQVEGVLDQVSWILLVMADRVAKWARTVATDVLEAAKGFAENAMPVVDLIDSGLEMIGALAEVKLPAATAIDDVFGFVGDTLKRVIELGKLPGLGDVETIGERINATVKHLLDALTGLVALGETDLANLQPAGWALGVDWITGLADGIRSGMENLRAAIAGVMDAFPTALTLPIMGTVPVSDEMGGGAAGGGQATQTINVTINNPVIRDETDIQALADQIGEVLAGRAATNRRMNVGWSGVG